jgi:hypothetical protein
VESRLRIWHIFALVGATVMSSFLTALVGNTAMEIGKRGGMVNTTTSDFMMFMAIFLGLIALACAIGSIVLAVMRISEELS